MGAREAGSAFFVGLDIAVDQVGDVVTVLFFFFEERVVGDIVVKLDIVVNDGRSLFIGGVSIFQRHEFDAGFRQLRFFVIGDGGAGRSARQSGRNEGRAAFGAENGVSVQIEEFSAAILTLAFAAELRFGQLIFPWSRPPVRARTDNDYRTVGLFAHRAAVNPLFRD